MVILVVGVLLRLGWGISHEITEAGLGGLPDQREYLSLGRNLLRGRLEFFDARFEESVKAYRTPGYPMLIAACGGNVRVVQMVQGALDASVILAVFLVARVWMEEKGALIAALLVAMNPFLIYFSALVLSETLFVAMLAWGMVVLVVPRRAPIRIIFGGLILALAVMVRPGAVLLPVILGAMGVMARPPSNGERVFAPAGTMVVLTLLVLLPWGVRNKVALGRWIWTTTNGGVTAYDGFNPDADGSSNQGFLAAMPWLKEMGEVERNDYLARKAVDYVRSNPVRAAELAVLHAARTWSPVPLSREYASARNVAVAAGYSVPLDLLVLLGIWRGKMPAAGKMFLLTPAVYLTVVHALSVGSLRYRLPAEVGMAVLAAAGVSYLLGRTEQPGETLS
jgi:4-amino-4-deoxy-L-arabinose transferase-like glycosyltransferase